MVIQTATRSLRLGAIAAAACGILMWGGHAALSAESKPDAGATPAAKEAPAAESPKAEPPRSQHGPEAKTPEGIPAPKQIQETEEKDWPCEQKYVDKLSWGTMWTGPSLDEALKSWHNNDGLREIVAYLVDDTTEDADGVKKIDEFAKSLKGDKGKQLTELFAALFETMGDRRTSFQESIKRYFRKQEAQAQQVNKLQADMRALEKKKVGPEDQRYKDLKKNLDWNNRVYDERKKLVPYVCQVPIIVEQKLGSYARAIQAQLSPSQ